MEFNCVFLVAVWEAHSLAQSESHQLGLCLPGLPARGCFPGRTGVTVGLLPTSQCSLCFPHGEGGTPTHVRPGGGTEPARRWLLPHAPPSGLPRFSLHDPPGVVKASLPPPLLLSAPGAGLPAITPPPATLLSSAQSYFTGQTLSGTGDEGGTQAPSLHCASSMLMPSVAPRPVGGFGAPSHWGSMTHTWRGLRVRGPWVGSWFPGGTCWVGSVLGPAWGAGVQTQPPDVGCWEG